MTILLNQTFPRTLDALVERFSMSPPGTRVEAWVFEDFPARASAEGRLLAHGVNARLRSAYKPLVHFFLEEADLTGSVEIAIPNHVASTAQRWRLEAYPLAGLLPEGALRFSEGEAPLGYVVRRGDSNDTVFAPNRLMTDHIGQQSLVPCGWLRVTDTDGTIIEDGPLETEFEQVFAAAMSCLAAHDWPTEKLFFRTLLIEARLPGIRRELAYGEEEISTAEALHEDFYFSILEWLKHRVGLAHGDRTLQPGQIVPDIRTEAGPAWLRVTLSDVTPEEKIQPGPADLEDADRPLTPAQINDALAELGGTPFAFTSVQGRKIGGAIFAGSGAPILISAGQHANETASVVGGLRAMRRLVAEGTGSLAFIPMENPDGHALHHTLREANPRHMLHAARYTALGDDLEARTSEPFHEKAARVDAIARTGANLHINLHGYPSHEWTRPLSGYLPRGFELWTIPKGFFLIVRHRPGLAALANAFAQALAAQLGEDPDLRAFNEIQLAVWKTHVGALSFPVFSSIPCLITEHATQLVDYTLITEYPDETIYGDAFRLAHRTQMRTVLAAVTLYRAGISENGLGGAGTSMTGAAICGQRQDS
jgi:hypothetical protein